MNITLRLIVALTLDVILAGLAISCVIHILN